MPRHFFRPNMDLPVQTNFENLLGSCTNDIITNGFKKSKMPSGMQDWFSGQVLRSLPNGLVISLISFLKEFTKGNIFDIDFDKDLNSKSLLHLAVIEGIRKNNKNYSDSNQSNQTINPTNNQHLTMNSDSENEFLDDHLPKRQKLSPTPTEIATPPINLPKLPLAPNLLDNLYGSEGQKKSEKLRRSTIEKSPSSSFLANEISNLINLDTLEGDGDLSPTVSPAGLTEADVMDDNWLIEGSFANYQREINLRQNQKIPSQLKTHNPDNRGMEWNNNDWSNIIFDASTGAVRPAADLRHSCPTCGEKFYFQKDYVEHMISYHRQKPFPCRLCPKSFSRTDTIRQHMKEKHPQAYHTLMADLTNKKMFVCPVAPCAANYASKSSIINHLKTVHPEAYTAQNLAVINSIGRIQRSRKYRVKKITQASRKVFQTITGLNEADENLQDNSNLAQNLDLPTFQKFNNQETIEEEEPTLQERINDENENFNNINGLLDQDDDSFDPLGLALGCSSLTPLDSGPEVNKDDANDIQTVSGAFIQNHSLVEDTETAVDKLNDSIPEKSQKQPSNGPSAPNDTRDTKFHVKLEGLLQHL